MLESRPRLKKAADMVRFGAPVVDVGTDHAYLPVYLLLNGKIPYAIAGDIGTGPLDNALQTVKKYGVENRITLVVSDGLTDIDIPHKANVTVCGMGGILMSEILEKSKEKLLSSEAHLVLQPMTHSEDVRKWLDNNGFEITSEQCVFDGGHTYCCIAADLTADTKKHQVGYYYFGTIEKVNEAEISYINSQLERIKKRLNGLSLSDGNSNEKALLNDVISYYESRYR